MSHRLILCAAACLAVAALPACAREPAAGSEPLPTALTDWHDAARAECERGGGTFRDGDYWQSGDFNGDGRPDFLVTRAAFGCDGNDIFSGGTSGDTYEALVSTATDYRLAEEAILAHDAKIAERNGRTVVLTPDDDDSTIEHQWAWDGSKLAITGKTGSRR
jgi:hypothetical protein